MKFLIHRAGILSFFLLLSLFIPSPSWARLILIVDLDNTLYDSVSYLNYNDEDIEGEIFAFNYISDTKTDTTLIRLLPGAQEFIQSLFTIPDTEIVFFSLGGKSRNLRLLKGTKLADGRNLLDAAKNRLISLEDLLNRQPYLPPEFHRKDPFDVCQFFSDFNEDKDEIIGIDDSITAYLAEYQDSVLWLKTEWEQRHVKAKNHANNNKNTCDEKPSHDMHRLVRARGVLELALRHAKKKKTTVKKALLNVQWIAKGLDQKLVGFLGLREGIDGLTYQLDTDLALKVGQEVLQSLTANSKFLVESKNPVTTKTHLSLEIKLPDTIPNNRVQRSGVAVQNPSDLTGTSPNSPRYEK